jgi:hypothetical protein
MSADVKVAPSITVCRDGIGRAGARSLTSICSFSETGTWSTILSRETGISFELWIVMRWVNVCFVDLL